MNPWWSFVIGVWVGAIFVVLLVKLPQGKAK